MDIGEVGSEGILDQGSINQLGIRHDQIRTTTHLRDLMGDQGVRNPLYLAVLTQTSEDFSNNPFGGLPGLRMDVFGKPPVAESTARGETGNFLQQFSRSDQHRFRCDTVAIPDRQPTSMSQTIAQFGVLWQGHLAIGGTNAVHDLFGETPRVRVLKYRLENAVAVHDGTAS